jgi:hypothetical protein
VPTAIEPPDIVTQAKPLSPREIVGRSLQFANHPSRTSWLKLFGEDAVSSHGAPELVGGRDVSRAAEWFQAALSDIAHDRQTREQLEAWLQTAKGVVPVPDYTIEGRHVRTTIQWRAPRQAFETTQQVFGVELSIDPDWVSGFLTGNPDALLATALMWLLDPDKSFPDVHECGRGPQCELERFFLRNRRYCCPEHTRQMNRSTNSERSRDRRERNKALELLKKRFPATAPDLVRAVKAPGLSAEQLFALAIKEHQRGGTRKRAAPSRRK